MSSAAGRRARLIEISEALPEVSIVPVGEGHLAIRIRKKTMAYYQFDHHGDGMISLVCKSSPSEQRRLTKADPENFFVPDYVGHKGWIGVRLDLVDVDWESVTECLRRAYQELAPRKLAVMID